MCLNELKWNVAVYPVRPHIYELQSVTAEEGTTAELVCHAEGNPVPQLHFSKFGESEALRVGENVSVFGTFWLRQSIDLKHFAKME